jgi:hypothetical protein
MLAIEYEGLGFKSSRCEKYIGMDSDVDIGTLPILE